MREDHEVEEDFVTEEAAQWHLRIYTGSSNPAGFDAVIVTLNGTLQSDLDWKEAKKQADQWIAQGFKILWKIECGLFNRLTYPLTHQSQFLSLTLALEHFRDSIWQEFKEHSLGLCLYQGPGNFQETLIWNDAQEHNYNRWLADHALTASSFYQQLFCQDVCVEYLLLLASRLPDFISVFLFLDVTTLNHPLQLLNPERFERFQLALKGTYLPFKAYGWHTSTPWGTLSDTLEELPELKETSIGLCIPSMDYLECVTYEKLADALSQVQLRGYGVRLVAESQLTAQWDGLDLMIYAPEGLSVQGKRKLQGFCAAGGTVITTNSFNGFAEEKSLNDWLKTL